MDPAIRYRKKRLTPSGEKRIYWKHGELARLVVAGGFVKHGMPSFGAPCLVAAYKQIFPKARSHAGARASMSRLMRRNDFKTALHWHYAVANGEIPPEPMPETVRGIGQRLLELGSFRVRRT